MARPIAGFLVAVMMVASMAGAGLAQAQAQAQTDRDILVDLYNATDGPNWLNNTNWLSDEPISEWYGVTTDGSGRVTWLDLPSNRLSGEIPAELGGLSNLEELFLGDNRLTGTIPSELGGLSNLTYLDLFRNQLTGAVPSGLSSLSNLEGLHLSDNQLTGAIPSGLGGLSNLEGLFLDSNQLTGAIPSELGDLSNLVDLFLAGNQLTGTIPSELAALSNLEQLFLADNQLSGEIPAELGNLSNLRQLDLRDNPTLSGPLPASFTGLTSLTYLRLDGTQLCAPTDAAFQAWLGGIGGRLGVVNCAADQRRTVTLSMMRPVVGAELKATLSDPDGAVTDVMWQWARSLDGTTSWADIAGATSMSYTPTPMDDGYYLRATATYTDPLASGKTSMAVSDHAVTEGDPLIARYDANANGMIDKAEVIAAINDYLFGDADEAISKTEVIRLINLYLFGPSTPSNPPGAPEGLTAAGNGQTRMDLSWSAPSSDGGAAITGYRIEVSENGSTWTGLVANTGNAATSYSHTGLRAGSTRHYRVSAINSAGTGPASNIVTGTTDECEEPLSGDGSVSGEWAAGCDSEARSGSHARYYTFNLEQDSDVTITLESTEADTYLNLWSGSDRTGTPLASDDNSPDMATSRITGNLTAGPYTIEATTYGEGETGTFTLTVSGLGASDPTPLYNDNIFVLPVSEGLAVELVAVPLPLEEYTKRFYEHFKDEFDFLFIARNLFHGVDVQGGLTASYNGVKNDVQGIGKPLFFNTDRWGSPGRLQGVIQFYFVGNSSPGHHEWTPIGRGPGLHEVMHRWANFTVPTADGSHWGFSSANGLLGGFDIALLEDHGSDRYTAGWFNTNGSAGRPFSPIELYLAGLAPPEEVPDLWVAEDGEWLLDSEGNSQLAPNGYPLFTASRIRTLTIEDIIAEHGQRIPAVNRSQRDFRAAVILLVNEDHPADLQVLERLSEEISWVSVPAFTDEGDKRRGNALRHTNFYESANGQATITMDGLAESLKDKE